MKKNIIIAAALVMLCLNSLKAQESAKVSALVTSQFSKQFSSATNVRWEQQKKQISMARFRQDNENWLAFYNKEGELISSGRQINSAQLPLNVKTSLSLTQKNLERKYGALTSGRTYEMISDRSTSYYIPLENDVMSIMVSIDSYGSSAVRRKAPKAVPALESKPFIAKKN